MSDMLQKIFVKQQEFMEMLREHDKFPEYPVDLTTKPGQRFVREIAFNLIEELMEASFCLRNKMHRLTDESSFDRPHYVEELGDALAYFIEICVVSGITADELYTEYSRKNRVVRERLQKGY